MTEADGPHSTSVASMVTDVAADVTRLVRQEIELATREVRAEVGKAARAGRMLTVGALAMHLVAVLASVAAVFAVAEVVADQVPDVARFAPALAAAAVALLWLLIGLTLLATGRRRLRSISPIPHQTIKSLKEDIAWLRRPTASGKK